MISYPRKKIIFTGLYFTSVCEYVCVCVVVGRERGKSIRHGIRQRNEQVKSSVACTHFTSRSIPLFFFLSANRYGLDAIHANMQTFMRTHTHYYKLGIIKLNKLCKTFLRYDNGLFIALLCIIFFFFYGKGFIDKLLYEICMQ